MNENNNRYQSDPFKIPTSSVQEEKEVVSYSEDSIKDKRIRKSREAEEEDVPKLKGLNLKLSPKLHEEYKIYCINIGETLQDHTLSLIKKELKKNK